MGWVKVHDQFPDHPKVVAAGPSAGWLYVCGLGYCSRYLTDGRIPKDQVRRLSALKNNEGLARKLVEVGLWEDHDDSYVVHDYSEWQLSSERVLADRAAARERRERRTTKPRTSPERRPTFAGKDTGDTGDPEEPSSSESSERAPDVATADDDDVVVSIVGQQALALLAQRALDDRKTPPVVAKEGPVWSDHAWLAATAAERRARYGARIVDLLGEHPDLSAEALADVLEPPAGPPVEVSEDASVRARRERDERLAARDRRPCPDCDAGFREGDGGVVPCVSCAATGVAGGVAAHA